MLVGRDNFFDRLSRPIVDMHRRMPARRQESAVAPEEGAGTLVSALTSTLNITDNCGTL